MSIRLIAEYAFDLLEKKLGGAEKNRKKTGEIPFLSQKDNVKRNLLKFSVRREFCLFDGSFILPSDSLSDHGSEKLTLAAAGYID